MKSAAITLLLLSALVTVDAQTRGGSSSSGAGSQGTVGQNNTGVGPNNTGPGQNNMSPPPTLPPAPNQPPIPNQPNQPNQVPGSVSSTAIGSNRFGFPTNQFGFGSSTFSNQFGFQTNQPLFNSNQFTVNTNVHGGITNLTPTGRTSGLEQLPPGFQPMPLPPGIQFRTNATVLPP